MKMNFIHAITQVFALNNLLAASLLLLVGMWFDTPETRGRFRTARDVLRQHRVAKVGAALQLLH
jgi:hypothetical protein